MSPIRLLVLLLLAVAAQARAEILVLKYAKQFWNASKSKGADQA